MFNFSFCCICCSWLYCLCVSCSSVFIVVFLYCVCALNMCNVCYLSVLIHSKGFFCSGIACGKASFLFFCRAGPPPLA
jgi:hypothetical protein